MRIPFFLPIILFLSFIPTLYGTIKVPLNEYNEWSIVHLAAAILHKKPVVIQAGSHHKDTLNDMSFFWPEGSIHIFEPNPAIFEELKNHVRTWNFNMNLYPCALADNTEKRPFYFDHQGINPKAGSLLQAADAWKWYYKESSVISIECQNLEDWAKAKGISSIDFLWLNTGGTELSILLSIPHLLNSIQLLVVETHFQEFRLGTGLYSHLKDFLDRSGFEEIKHWKTPDFQGFAIFSKKGLVKDSL